MELSIKLYQWILNDISWVGPTEFFLAYVLYSLICGAIKGHYAYVARNLSEKEKRRRRTDEFHGDFEFSNTAHDVAHFLFSKTCPSGGLWKDAYSLQLRIALSERRSTL
ncbi:TPA: hypothetical protein ACGU7E_003290 [Vibrio vulnificus]